MMKCIVRAIALGPMFTVALIPSTTFSQPLSLTSLQASCAQKTLLYNWSGERIGEGFNDYCRGLLEGIFATMKHERSICEERQIDAPVLLSVVNTYVADKKIGPSDDASDVIISAFRRAFGCQK